MGTNGESRVRTTERDRVLHKRPEVPTGGSSTFAFEPRERPVTGLGIDFRDRFEVQQEVSEDGIPGLYVYL